MALCAGTPDTCLNIWTVLCFTLLVILFNNTTNDGLSYSIINLGLPVKDFTSIELIVSLLLSFCREDVVNYSTLDSQHLIGENNVLQHSFHFTMMKTSLHDGLMTSVNQPQYCLPTFGWLLLCDLIM